MLGSFNELMVLAKATEETSSFAMQAVVVSHCQEEMSKYAPKNAPTKPVAVNGTDKLFHSICFFCCLSFMSICTDQKVFGIEIVLSEFLARVNVCLFVQITIGRLSVYGLIRYIFLSLDDTSKTNRSFLSSRSIYG